MNETNAKPFLKWAGGKRQLITQLEQHYPKRLMENELTTYIEPFAGGGALFFELQSQFAFEKVILNDYNPDLILTYKVVRDAVDLLIPALQEMESEYLQMTLDEQESEYYDVRKAYNQGMASIDYTCFSPSWVTHASQLIFLNKTGFCGLYRVNGKGEFNVSWGKNSHPTICDAKNLIAVHQALQGVILTHGDFEGVSHEADEHTLMFLDPPYRPLSDTAVFTAYSKSLFNDETQIRLAQWFRRMHAEKKASLMLCNSDPTNTDDDDLFFDNLYADFTITRLSASRNINSNPNRRGVIQEILVTNEASASFQCIS